MAELASFDGIGTVDPPQATGKCSVSRLQCWGAQSDVGATATLWRNMILIAKSASSFRQQSGIN